MAEPMDLSDAGLEALAQRMTHRVYPRTTARPLIAKIAALARAVRDATRAELAQCRCEVGSGVACSRCRAMGAHMPQEDAMREPKGCPIPGACACPPPRAPGAAGIEAWLVQHGFNPHQIPIVGMSMTPREWTSFHATVATLLADATAAGAREVADWYRETFCPAHGVTADETHARGDCEACNIAAAIRARVDHR